MPAKNPRVSAVVDRELDAWLRQEAARRGISVSLLVRDLLKKVQEEEEERFLAREGEARLESFAREEAVDHGKAWG